MIIHHAIIHILDKNNGNLLLSETELDLTKLPTMEYITKLVDKTLQADLQQSQLNLEHDLIQFLLTSDFTFIEKTQQLAQKLFDILLPAEDIAAADYLFLSGLDTNGQDAFAIIRLDYQERYTHLLEYEDNQVSNQLVLNQTILPTATQKTTQAFFINLTTFQYQIIEKSAMIEGKKVPYFSQLFLEIESPTATSSQIKALKKTVKQVAERFNEENYVAMAKTQSAIYEQLETNHEIDAKLLFDTIFEHNEPAKQATQELLIEEKIPEKIEVHNVPKYERKYSKQKFKLANGIELTIPMDVFKDRDTVEFINNPDGSISVMIKNIENIMSHFNG